MHTIMFLQLLKVFNFRIAEYTINQNNSSPLFSGTILSEELVTDGSLCHLNMMQVNRSSKTAITGYRELKDGQWTCSYFWPDPFSPVNNGKER